MTAPLAARFLGTGFADGQMAHAVVPARTWQAAEPLGAGFELAPHGWRPRYDAR